MACLESFIIKEKASLRQKYLQLREGLSLEDIKNYSIQIKDRVAQIDSLWEYQNYHIFLSIPKKKEVDTSPLLTLLKEKKKTIFVPKISPKTQTLNTYLVDQDTKIESGLYGIPEPSESHTIYNPEKLEVMFIPLLAFDKTGNRIGYGKGFYDKLLSQCNKDLLKVGLSSFKPEDHVPHESFDIKLDVCITPQEVYIFNTF